MENYSRNFIRAYFDVVADMAGPSTPLHRAKAMKVALSKDRQFSRELGISERDDFWAAVKKSGCLKLSEEGHLLGLTAEASAFLDTVKR